MRAPKNRSAVPGVFPVGGNSESDIRIAVASAIAAGGGQVMLPNASVTLTAPLILHSGVSYIGANPSLQNFTINVPDSGWDLLGGTILVGDGTFPAFAPGLTDYTTYFDDRKDASYAATCSTGTDLFTISADLGWVTGMAAWVTRTTTGGTMPTGVVEGTVYYLIRVSGTTYKLATTRANAKAGTNIDLTGSPAGTFTINTMQASTTIRGNSSYTTSITGGTINIASGGSRSADFYVGQGVVFNSAVTNIVAGTTYYIKTIDYTTHDITVAATPGGTAIAAGNGSPTMTTWGANAVSGFEIAHIGFNNFSSAFSVGAMNQMGANYFKLHDCWALGCVTNVYSWATRMTNCMHSEFYNFWSYGNSNGFYVSACVDQDHLQPGNCRGWRNLYHITPTTTAKKNRQSIGFQFHSKTAKSAAKASILNEMEGSGLQCNLFSRAHLTESGTSAAGSPNIAVADSSEYLVGMPVVMTTGAPTNFTNNQVYVVVSIPDATHITLGDDIEAGAISAGNIATPTLSCYGMPAFAVTTDATTGTVNNCTFTGLDLEGDSHSVFYGECLSGSYADIVQVSSSNAKSHCTLRHSQNCFLSSGNAIKRDWDSYSGGSCRWEGPVSTIVQSSGIGVWKDTTTTNSIYRMNIGPNTGNSADIERRQPSNSFLYPLHGMGQKVTQWDADSLTITADQGGILVSNPAAAVSWTLPTIVTEGTDPISSHVGLIVTVVNSATSVANTITVSTGGGQTLNNESGYTSEVIPIGTWVTFVASKNQAGTLFWTVIPGPGVGDVVSVSHSLNTYTLPQRAIHASAVRCLSGPNGAATITFPTNTPKGVLYFVFNESTQTSTVKVSGQAGVVGPAAGKRAIFYSNGTDMVRLMAMTDE